MKGACQFIVVLIACFFTSTQIYAVAIEPTHTNKEISTLDNYEAFLDRQLTFCRTTDQKGLIDLFRSLTNQNFLNQLDDPATYINNDLPFHLLALLSCIAERHDVKMVPDALATLGSSPFYAMDNKEGSLRLDTLIIASGNVQLASKNLLQLLQGHVAANNEKSGLAIQALSKIGSQETLSVLWNFLFNPQTTVIKKELQEIYLPDHAMELCQYRNKPDVMTFLLETLYQSELRNAAILCITEDIIEQGPDEEFNLIAAPLDNNTERGINLAGALARWFANEVDTLKTICDITIIAKRITDLLGLELKSINDTTPQGIKNWSIQQFDTALHKEKDADRKQEIEKELKRL